jgi:predicted transcriptional regulator
MLDVLGVGQLAEDVYRALLNHGPCDENRLAEYVAEDADTVRKGLSELSELELACLVQESPRRWRAGSPDVALTSLVVRQQETLLERQRELERAQLAVSQLVQLARTRRSDGTADMVEITNDPDATRRRCSHLARTAEQCIMALDKLPHGSAPSEPCTPHDESGERELLERGVEIQAIYERSALLVPGRFDMLRRLASAGEQARTLPTLPVKLVVYDRAHAAVQLDDPEDAPPTVMFVHRSALVDGFVQLFELLWDRGVPLPPSADAALPDRGAEFDDVLVALLAAGFKDESIARNLGISCSTVTRRMARLMELSGTSTRFQLGMQAVRRGWI